VADEKIQREVLPIPDRRPVGLTTYDAKDPDTSFPRIEPLRPPAEAPNVLATADQPLPAGTRQVRMEFAYDGGGIGKGGTATLFVDGNQVGSTRIDRTHAFNYSLCETGGVGTDAGSPVADGYPAGDNAFTGQINWVRIDLGADSHDHLLDPKQLFHFAMTRQ
jgi:hypothetical protein